MINYIFILLLFLSCNESYKRKVIYSDDGKNAITIISKDKEHYIVNGIWKSNKLPKTEYIYHKADVIEYYPIYVQWSNKKVLLYVLYGDFEVSKANNIELIEINVKEQQKLKIDSFNYKYFYY